MPKNVRQNQLKTCIFFELEEFEMVIQDLYGEEARVDLEDFQLAYHIPQSYPGEEINERDIFDKLGEYLGVYITSIHNDLYDVIGVWICYKED